MGGWPVVRRAILSLSSFEVIDIVLEPTYPRSFLRIFPLKLVLTSTVANMAAPPCAPVCAVAPI